MMPLCMEQAHWLQKIGSDGTLLLSMCSIGNVENVSLVLQFYFAC